MSKNITLDVFSPKYVQDFRCAGSECVDTCCYGWKIFIDKKSYYAIKNAPSPVLRKTIDLSIVRNPESKSLGDFAAIKTNELNHCGLLQEDSLCGLHAHLGEDYLPDVCAIYPKNTIQIKVQKQIVNQQFATSSCPEIAKLIIKKKDSMEIVESCVSTRLSSISVYADAQSYRLNLSAFYAEVLQHAKDYALWQRVMFLNLCSRELEQLASLDSLDELIDRYSLSLQDSAPILQAFSEYRWDSSLTSSIAGGLFSIRAALGTSSRYYHQLLSQIEQWVLKKNLDQISGNHAPDRALTFEDFSGAAEHIVVANEQYWLPWIQKNSEPFSRILANEVLRVLLPLDKESTVDAIGKGTLQLTMHYVLLRFLVTLQAAIQEKPIDDDMFLSVVHPYFREVIHSPIFLRQMTDVLKNTGLDKLSRLAMILPDQ